MNIRYVVFFVLISIFIIFINNGLCISGKDMVKLKKGGISDETIQVMIREKTLETCQLTVENMLELKKAGISEETIRMVVEEGSFLKDSEPVIYGKDIKSIKFTTAKDIVEFKKAGISDEIIQAIIIFGSSNIGNIEREKAWDMLKRMGIVVDLRRGRKDRLFSDN